MTKLVTTETSKVFHQIKDVYVTGGTKRLALTIPLNPVPASRPRVSKYGTYYSKTYATWKKQAQLYMPSDVDEVPFDMPVIVFVEHIIKMPKTTKLIAPRGDVDNYTKAAFDAVTKCGGVWTDDDLVVLAVEAKRWVADDEEPRTEITVVEL